MGGREVIIRDDHPGGRSSMEHLIRGVRDAVHKRSLYAATALALMLPEVCAVIEDPGRGKSKQRYIRWADRWAQWFFTAQTGKVFLSGTELYLVRCSFLHQGDFATSDEAPKAADDSAAMFEVLNRVTLYDDDEIAVVPARNMTSNGSERSTSYSIGVRWLCESICSATESWLAKARTDPTLAERVERIGQSGAIMQILPYSAVRPL
jgi:hypothetical protein